jgi:hypothetical protein
MAKLQMTGWVPCPPGEFRQLENHLWFLWLGKVVRTTAVAMLAAGALALAVGQIGQAFFSSPPADSRPCPSPSDPCTPTPKPETNP